MHGTARQERITSHVERYLSLGSPLPDFLQAVEPDLCAEVAAQCQEAAFVEQYFASLQAPGHLPPRPDRIGGCALLECLGEGAMGEVHRAHQADLGRDVAIKIVRADLAHRDDFIARFRAEANLLAALDHPGIVKVLHCGEQDGWCYFIMDLVPGRSLAEALPDLQCSHVSGPPADGKQPRRFDRVARIVAEILETLAYAHGQGIVHRDLKPSNIMLDRDEHPKLVDFGLAKAANSPQRTLPGTLVGTPAYLSPEVAGRTPHDRCAPDLWAVGVLLHLLLTGRLPYDGRTTDAVLQAVVQPVRRDPRTHNPSVPSPLAAICSKALAPQPELRYASAQQFAADLRRHLANEPVLAQRWSPWSALRAHVRRRRGPYAAAGAAAAIAAVAWLWAAQRAATVQWTALVRRLTDLGSLASLPAAELADHAASARAMLRDGALPASAAAQVQTVLADVEQEAHRRHAVAGALVLHGAGSPKDTPLERYRAPSPAEQFEGLRGAAEAAVVVPGLADAAALAQAAFPTLTVAAPFGAATAALRIDELDPTTGMPLRELFVGNAPFQTAIPPGYYRIVVGDAERFAECTRMVMAPGNYDVEPVVRATAAALHGMVPVPAGRARIGQDKPGARLYAMQEVTHEAFYIDRTEVSCGDYQRFLAATGAAAPWTWKTGYDPAWELLPVVGVTAAEAARYAEWVGKRLPTWTEWQIAARGRSGSLFPWGDDPSPLATLPSLGHDRDLPWFQCVLPVGTVAADVSWCGALDMLGNIDEWTETPYVALFDGLPFPVYPWRVRGGAAWNDKRVTEYVTLDLVGPGPPEHFGTGFRCAKSADPKGK